MTGVVIAATIGGVVIGAVGGTIYGTVKLVNAIIGGIPEIESAYVLAEDRRKKERRRRWSKWTGVMR